MAHHPDNSAGSRGFALASRIQTVPSIADFALQDVTVLVLVFTRWATLALRVDGYVPVQCQFKSVPAISFVVQM